MYSFRWCQKYVCVVFGQLVLSDYFYKGFYPDWMKSSHTPPGAPPHHTPPKTAWMIRMFWLVGCLEYLSRDITWSVTWESACLRINLRINLRTCRCVFSSLKTKKMQCYRREVKNTLILVLVLFVYLNFGYS